ncbi:galactokinase [Arthrobacter halodurans]|uniref:Galactokinase n=1 Tax=Arthrobacter halodurans TaxID=516699 RepID=A0ABV4USC5_9MICC
MSVRNARDGNANDGGGLAAVFAEVYGGEPDGVWAAPGRVNLIGEHTDYNEGFVLPFAIDRTARVAVRLRRGEPGMLRVATLQGDGGRVDGDGAGGIEVDDPGTDGGPSGRRRPGVVEVAPDAMEPAAVPPWARYIAGVVWAFRQRGVDVPALDVLLDSDVPIGAGLSSSAAIECAVALAVDDLTGSALGREELVLLCRRAENDFVGAPTGILDQSASLLGTAEHALFLDCRSRAARQVSLPLAAAGLSILVVDTKVSHAHDTGGYKALVAACDRGARELGVSALRDVPASRLGEARDVLDYVAFHRVRHIVTENERVLETVRLLEGAEADGAEADGPEADGAAAEARGPGAIGELLTASHASMRDDFEISCAELDLAVDAALGAGALGARMTGGGFGGSAIALVRRDAAGTVAERVRDAFVEAGFARPDIFGVAPGPGARRL